MCVCFHGEGRNPCWKYQLQRASGVSNCFLSGCAGVNIGHYQSTALILFYSFNFLFHLLIANHWALYLEEVNWNDIFVKRPAKDTAHPLFSILDGLFLFCCLWDLSGEHRQLAGKVPKLGSVISWHKEHLCGNELSQLLSCDTAEKQSGPNQMGKHDHISAFQLGWWLHSEQIFRHIRWEGMGEYKHLKYKYIKYNGKANTYRPGYFYANILGELLHVLWHLSNVRGALCGDGLAYWSMVASSHLKSIARKGRESSGARKQDSQVAWATGQACTASWGKQELNQLWSMLCSLPASWALLHTGSCSVPGHGYCRK